MVLLHFLRWLRENSRLQFDVLLLRGGDLEGEFRETARVWMWPTADRLRHQLLQALTQARKRLLRQLHRQGFGLLYGNTAATCSTLLTLLEGRDTPSVLHVHELETVLRYYCDYTAFKACVPRMTRTVSVSELVRENLIAEGVPKEGIDLVHEFLPSVPSIDPSFDVRLRHGIPADRILVGASGTPDWRKGVDLFIQVAKTSLQERGELPLHFIWIGGRVDSAGYAQALYDVRKAGLTEHVTFIGSVPNPADYYAALDVLLMTSREDPFPLVCLEAASLGVPIICFENAIGSTEFIDSDCGGVVPYLDVAAMVRALFHLAEDSRFRREAGKRIAGRVQPYRIEQCGPRLLKTIEGCLE